jgi:hypothetical protein
MEETQNELQIGVGTEEAITLKPGKVKILKVEVGEFGVKKAKKVVCHCKHQDSEVPIKISSAKFERKGKLEVSGLWVNKDSKGLIKKGSCLAVTMQSLGAPSIIGLEGKEPETVNDESGYLVIKAY